MSGLKRRYGSVKEGENIKRGVKRKWWGANVMWLRGLRGDRGDGDKGDGGI